MWAINGWWNKPESKGEQTPETLRSVCIDKWHQEQNRNRQEAQDWCEDKNRRNDKARGKDTDLHNGGTINDRQVKLTGQSEWAEETQERKRKVKHETHEEDFTKIKQETT